jgi:cobalt-zinc-cadmium efflux system outer membrane protein
MMAHDLMKRTRRSLSFKRSLNGLVILASLGSGIGSGTTHARPKLITPKDMTDHGPQALVDGSEALSVLLDLEKTALGRFPSVQVAQQERLRADADLRSAKGAFWDPTLKAQFQSAPVGKYTHTYSEAGLTQSLPLLGAQLTASYKISDGEFAVYDLKNETGSAGEWKLGVEIPLLRNSWIDFRRSRIEIADFGQKGAEQNLSQQEMDTLRQVRQRFWSWVAAVQQVHVQKALLDLAKAREKQLTESVRLGDAPEIDLVDNARAITQRESSLALAERQLDKAALDLSLYSRGETGELVVWEREKHQVRFPSLIELTQAHLNEGIEKGLASHPEVLRQKAVLEQASVEKRLAKNQLLPKLDAFATTYTELGTLPQEQGLNEVRAGIQFEFPIPNRNAIGRNDSAETQVIRQELNLQLQQDRLRLSLVDAFQSVQVSAERVKLARAEIQQALRLEEAERIRFANGMSTLFLINLREQTTADAQIREVSALETHFRAWADFQYSAASPWKNN